MRDPTLAFIVHRNVGNVHYFTHVKERHSRIFTQSIVSEIRVKVV